MLEEKGREEGETECNCIKLVHAYNQRLFELQLGMQQAKPCKLASLSLSSAGPGLLQPLIAAFTFQGEVPD